MKIRPVEMALLVEVLLHFRSVLKAAILDLKKANQLIYMRDMDLHLKQFIWSHGRTVHTHGQLSATRWRRCSWRWQRSMQLRRGGAYQPYGS